MSRTKFLRNFWDTLKIKESIAVPDSSLYKYLTPRAIAEYAQPPTSVRMLTKTFIHDSLYNPNYGYFSKQVSILSPMDRGMDFSKMTDNSSFSKQLNQLYEDVAMADGRELPQIWHTPTELFKVTTFKIKLTIVAIRNQSNIIIIY